jgi:hypothetical protein
VAHVVFGRTKRGDLGIVARLLRAEVVGRKAQDDRSAIALSFVERFERGVLRREPALRRNVHDEQHVTGKLALRGGAVDSLEGNVRECRHGDIVTFRTLRPAVRADVVRSK